MSATDPLATIQREIPRADYLALVSGAGFDVNHLRALRFTAAGIYAEVYAVDDEGEHILDGEDPAVHTVFVRAVD